jgi:hypothetical protein
MNKEDLDKLISKLRIRAPEEIAKEIVSVQPIDSKIFKDLVESASSEEDLIREGYVPVDNQTKLLWHKLQK